MLKSVRAVAKKSWFLAYQLMVRCRPTASAMRNGISTREKSVTNGNLTGRVAISLQDGRLADQVSDRCPRRDLELVGARASEVAPHRIVGESPFDPIVPAKREVDIGV